MATTPVTVNGTTVSIPLAGDNAGQAGAAAIAQLLGLLFAGVAQVNGSVPLVNVRSSTVPNAAGGTIQLGAADTIRFRSPDDTFDVSLGEDAGGSLTIGPLRTSTVASGNFSLTWSTSLQTFTITQRVDPLGLFSTGALVLPANGVYLVELSGTATFVTATASVSNVQVWLGAPASPVVIAGVASGYSLNQTAYWQSHSTAAAGQIVPMNAVGLWSVGAVSTFQLAGFGILSTGTAVGVIAVHQVA
jgi:hypothetical protein